MEAEILKLKEKLSLQKCRVALGNSKTKYSDAELLAIRDLLYDLAEVDYNVFIFNEQKDREFENEANDNLETAA